MVSRTPGHAGWRDKDETPGKERNQRHPTRSAGTSGARTGAPASLRLVHPPHRAPHTAGQAQAPPAAAIHDATDPRWVLAMRTAEALEGTVLRPEKRDSLLRLARVLNLTAFDANLVIAMIQDQARRGIAPAQCPAAAASQLALVPVPTDPGPITALKDVARRPAVLVPLILMGLILAEIVLLTWFF